MKRAIYLIIFLLCIQFSLAESPTAYINETATVDFSNAGNIINLTGTGYVEVETPNTLDVLQFLRLNLTDTNATNLLSSESYRSVAVSPLPGYKTRMFLRTQDSAEDLEYSIINSNNLKRINLRLDYLNVEGGTALSFNKTSVYLFRVFLNSERNLGFVNITIKSKKDTYYLNDSINITQAFASEPGYTTNVVDTDSDGWNDGIDLIGYINANQNVTITFTATTTPNLNYNGSEIFVDLDQDFSVNTLNSYNDTLTGITFTDKFSRGPIREGITIIPLDSPEGSRIRGFIKNIASGLNYTVNSWALYRIDNLTTAVLNSITPIPLQPTETLFTEWYAAQPGEKPYYTTAFDWRVDWDKQFFSGIVKSRTKLPQLTGLEIFGDKTVTACETCQEVVVYVQDLLKHIGHIKAEIDNVQINSTVPSRTTSNNTFLFTISEVKVLYENATGRYDITGTVNYTITNPNSTNDGYVYLNFNALTSIGHPIRQNEKVYLNYTLKGTPVQQNLQLKFDSSFEAKTATGSSYKTTATRTVIIFQFITILPPTPPATGGGGGGGGGGGAAAATNKYDIIKEYSNIEPVKEMIAEVEVIDGFVAGTDGIKQSGVSIYMPEGTELDKESVNIMEYSSSTDKWNRLVNGASFGITYKGIERIGDQQYKSYLITKTGGDWTFYTRDKIRIQYLVNLSVGSNYILTRVFGTIPKGEKIFEDAYTPMRIAPGLETIIKEQLQIKEGEWEQEERIDVGRPGTWMKSIEIYNPNKGSAEGDFSFQIFSDVLNAYIIEGGIRKDVNIQKTGDKTKVTFHDTFLSNERKVYFIEAITPPIMESKKELNVIETNESLVTFELNITIENTAEEDYKNIFYKLPIDTNKILSVKDNSGELNYTDHIRIERIAAEKTKNITIIYKEKVPVVDSLTKLEYPCTSPINYTLFVIPSETSKELYVETELTGPEKENNLIYADITDLGKMEVGKQVRIPKNFGAQYIPAGKYTITSKLRKDFLTITSKERELLITCPPKKGINWLLWLSLLIILLIVYMNKCRIKKTLFTTKCYRLEYLLIRINNLIKQERYFLEKNINLVDPAKIHLIIQSFKKATNQYKEIITIYSKWVGEKEKCRLSEEEKKNYSEKIMEAYKELSATRVMLVHLIEAIKNKNKSKEEYKEIKQEITQQKTELNIPQIK